MAAFTKIGGVTVDQLLMIYLKGVNTSLPAGTTLVIENVTYDPAALVQKLQTVIAPFALVDSLHTQLANAVKARTESEDDAVQFAEDLETALKYLFGHDANLLSSLGVQASKPRRQLTAQQKVARAAKSAATRAMRGTKGSRQKAAVKSTGEVEVTATVSDGTTTAASTSGTAAAQEVNGTAH